MVLTFEKSLGPSTEDWVCGTEETENSIGRVREEHGGGQATSEGLKCPQMESAERKKAENRGRKNKLDLQKQEVQMKGLALKTTMHTL